MELGSGVQFLEEKRPRWSLVQRVFVEKILRGQPNLKRFYLLIRAADATSARERLHDEVIGKDLFRVLREKHGAGLLNFAATTNFDERYDVALDIKTMGALHVLDFAKKCVNIKMLVHVSTAYVCGEDAGIILEEPFPMGKAKKGTNKTDIGIENKLVKEKLYQLQLESSPDCDVRSAMKDFGFERARLYGWPNTCVFTKAMGEMKDDLPLAIIRPTIVSSTYKDPFPGWIEGLRNIDSLIAGYGKGSLKCFISNPKSAIDVIPADMVVNAIIVAMVAHAGQKTSGIIYHVGSSLRNPALHLVNMLLFRKHRDACAVLDRKLKLLRRLTDLFKPYVLFEGIFDDKNSEKLQIASIKKDYLNFE